MFEKRKRHSRRASTLQTSDIFFLFLSLFQVKVILRVAKGAPHAAAADEQPTATAEPGGNFMSVDQKHRQLTLIDPNAPPASDGSRRVGVAAPKMFAFDALFTQDDSQVIQKKTLLFRYDFGNAY